VQVLEYLEQHQPEGEDDAEVSAEEEEEEKPAK
jgi:hypothetical protein